MNKETYLAQLNKKLQKLPEDDRIDALQYYDEYITEAKTEDIVESFGTPQQLAANIIGKHYLKQMNKADATGADKRKVIWLAVLAILSSPLTVPLAVATIIVVLAFILVGGIFLLCLYLFALCGVLIVAFSAICTIVLIPVHFPTAIFSLGLLCVGISVTFIFWEISRKLTVYFYQVIKERANKILARREV